LITFDFSTDESCISTTCKASNFTPNQAPDFEVESLPETSPVYSRSGSVEHRCVYGQLAAHYTCRRCWKKCQDLCKHRITSRQETLLDTNLRAVLCPRAEEHQPNPSEDLVTAKHNQCLPHHSPTATATLPATTSSPNQRPHLSSLPPPSPP
jgi:hypothetical protein